MKPRDIVRGGVRYRLYPDGRVWSYYRNRFMVPDIDRDGYHKYRLGDKLVRIGRVMLETFKRKPRRGEECLHRDGEPGNNAIGNLSWGTQQKNWKDRKRHGRVNAKARWSDPAFRARHAAGCRNAWATIRRAV